MMALRELHSLGYTHRDLKPDNMLLSAQQDQEYEENGIHKIVLIDFGEAQTFLDEDGDHLPDELTPVCQNEWFASKHAFSYHRCSRRDDVIQGIYVLIFLHTRLYNVRDEAPTVHKIGDFKKTATAERMCRGTPLEPVLSEAYTYKYDQIPDYGKIIFLLKEAMMKLGMPPCPSFQWVIGGNEEVDDEGNVSEGEADEQIM